MTVVCNACGQEWLFHPALLVPCPKCGAKTKQPCQRPSGHSGPFVAPHVEREQSALDLGELQMCPEGPSAKESRLF